MTYCKAHKLCCFFFLSSTTLCEFWFAQLFLSMVSFPVPSVSNYLLPSSSNHLHTLCMLDKYKATHTHTHTHTLRIFNNHFFSTPTMVTQTCLNNVSSLLYCPPFIHHGHMFCDTETPAKVEGCRKQENTQEHQKHNGHKVG